MSSMKEFRFVIDEKTLKSLNVDSKKALDFNDYYLTRNKRVRHFLDGRKEDFVLIISEPGMIVKRKVSINEKEAQEFIKEAEKIIKKKGIGHIFINGDEGYIERVSAFKPNEKKPFLDEIQIEFELDSDKLIELKATIKPLKVIEQGLYDYTSKVL